MSFPRALGDTNPHEENVDLKAIKTITPFLVPILNYDVKQRDEKAVGGDFGRIRWGDQVEDLPPIENIGRHHLAQSFAVIAGKCTADKISKEAKFFLEKSKGATVFRCGGTTNLSVLQENKKPEEYHSDPWFYRGYVFVGVALPFQAAEVLFKHEHPKEFWDLGQQLYDLLDNHYHYDDISEAMMVDCPVARTIDGKYHFLLEGDHVAGPTGAMALWVERYRCEYSRERQGYHFNVKNVFSTPLGPKTVEGWPEPFRLGWPLGPHIKTLRQLEKK